MKTETMTTTEINKDSHHATDLQTRFEVLLEEIKDFLNKTHIEKNDKPIINTVYQFTGDLSKLKPKVQHLNNAGICRRRVLKRMLRKVEHKMSLININRLFHFIEVYIIEKKSTVKVTCEKDRKIQMLRKEWKKLQSKSDLALKEYKEEKGDFYKQI